jgi:hypothetical protein
MALGLTAGRCLIDQGFKNLTGLDLSEVSLEAAKARLGGAAAQVHWIVANVAIWKPLKAYDLRLAEPIPARRVG